MRVEKSKDSKVMALSSIKSAGRQTGRDTRQNSANLSAGPKPNVVPSSRLRVFLQESLPKQGPKVLRPLGRSNLSFGAASLRANQLWKSRPCRRLPPPVIRPPPMRSNSTPRQHPIDSFFAPSLICSYLQTRPLRIAKGVFSTPLWAFKALIKGVLQSLCRTSDTDRIHRAMAWRETFFSRLPKA
jgi:hypothetical protein